MLSLDGRILGINTYKQDTTFDGRPVDGIGFALSGPNVRQRVGAYIDNPNGPLTRYINSHSASNPDADKHTTSRANLNTDPAGNADTYPRSNCYANANTDAYPISNRITG